MTTLWHHCEPGAQTRGACLERSWPFDLSKVPLHTLAQAHILVCPRTRSPSSHSPTHIPFPLSSVSTWRRAALSLCRAVFRTTPHEARFRPYQPRAQPGVLLQALRHCHRPAFLTHTPDPSTPPTLPSTLPPSLPPSHQPVDPRPSACSCPPHWPPVSVLRTPRTSAQINQRPSQHCFDEAARFKVLLAVPMAPRNQRCSAAAEIRDSSLQTLSFSPFPMPFGVLS